MEQRRPSAKTAASALLICAVLSCVSFRVELPAFVPASRAASGDAEGRRCSGSLGGLHFHSSPQSCSRSSSSPFSVSNALLVAGSGREASFARLVGVVAAAVLAWTSLSRRTRSRRCSRTVRQALSDEEKLLKLVDEFPDDFDGEDVQEVLQACRKVRGVPNDAFQQFVGSWRMLWNSDSGCTGKPKPATSLKFRSKGALPAVKVQFTGTFCRTLEVGGTYEKVETFTLPEADGAEAGLVMAGPWSTGSSQGEWGQGAARTRCSTNIESVRLALPLEGSDASEAMLEAAGLGGHLEAQGIPGEASYFDLDYISETTCVSKDESGTVNILTRLPDGLPFKLD